MSATPDQPSQLDLLAIEHDVMERWQRDDVPARVGRHRPDGRRWVTYEGPPTANGAPALHHVWTSVYKDIYARFQVMRGRRVDRRAGWDCQGLPVEIAVEKKLGLKSKREVERYGVAEFVEECRRFVEGNIAQFESTFQRVAYWVDYPRAYRTMDDAYIESVWWHLGTLWDRGLIFEGHRVVPYCYRCGTTLSSHELGQPEVYRDRTDQAAYVGLRLDDRPAEIVVWTTTPWTLVGNVAVAVRPDSLYGVYAVNGRKLIVAVDRAADVFGDAAPLETFKGADIVGETYTRPYPDVEPDVVGRVVGWAEVAMDMGSGAVHIAPAFGEEDGRLGAEQGLPTVNPVDDEGRYTAGPFHGANVLEAVPEVLADLDERGLLVEEHPYTHSYPHCWRCRTPLIYWAKRNWFIRTSGEAQRFVEENEKIAWHPETIKHGRFGNWLKTNVDWAVTRDRYWGTPLPVWRCPNGHHTCVASRDHLSELTGSDERERPLHRPWIDEVAFPCPDCGEQASREPLVCDVWLDSGCMPAAQLNHPKDSEPLSEHYPADFICEAIDQTRGWFYSLLAVNTMVFESTPYLNCVCLGLLVDDEGRKMSKSVGNVLDPVQLVERFGADAVRWYLLSGGAPWGSRRISESALEQRRRTDLDRLWNVVSFYSQYAALEGFEASRGAPPPQRHVLDRWIVSRAAGLIESATAGFEEYRGHVVAHELAELIDDLSNWYVRRARRRFWGTDGSDPDAFQTLHYALTVVVHLLAPFCPFLSDAIYRVLGLDRQGEDSVHLSDWPAPGPRDPRLEQEMQTARLISSLGRSARSSQEISVRQPLRRAVVAGADLLSDDVVALVADEINVATIEPGGNEAVPIRFEARPNWRRLGPRYRGLVDAIATALQELGPAEIDRVRSGQALNLQVAGEPVTVEPEDVEVTEQIETGWALASDGGIQVALDTTLDDELTAEYERRQAIRQIQLARREFGLSISDRLSLWLAPSLWPAREDIAKEVLAVRVLSLADIDEDAGADYFRGESFAFARAPA